MSTLSKADVGWRMLSVSWLLWGGPGEQGKGETEGCRLSAHQTTVGQKYTAAWKARSGPTSGEAASGHPGVRPLALPVATVNRTLAKASSGSLSSPRAWRFRQIPHWRPPSPGKAGAEGTLRKRWRDRPTPGYCAVVTEVTRVSGGVTTSCEASAKESQF